MATKIEQRAHINAFIDTRDRERLFELARERDRSVSAEIRRAIAAHVERGSSEPSPLTDGGEKR